MIDIYYDGQCNFCLRSLSWLHRFDDTRRLNFLDGNEPSNAERLSQLTHGRLGLDRAMWAVTSGKAYEGYHAFRIVLLALPRLRWFAKIMNLAPVVLVGRYAYWIIAANRRNLGCRI